MSNQPKRTLLERIGIWICCIPVLGKIIENTIESIRFGRSETEVRPFESIFGWMLEAIGVVPLLGPWLLRRFGLEVVDQKNFELDGNRRTFWQSIFGILFWPVLILKEWVTRTPSEILSEDGDEVGPTLVAWLIGTLKVLGLGAIFIMVPYYALKLTGNNTSQNFDSTSKPIETVAMDEFEKQDQSGNKGLLLKEYFQLDTDDPQTNLTLMDKLGKKIEIANRLIKHEKHNTIGYEFRLRCCIEFALICINGKISVPDEIVEGLQTDPDLEITTAKLSSLQMLGEIVEDISKARIRDQNWVDLENRLEEFLTGNIWDHDLRRLLNRLAKTSSNPDFHVQPNRIGDIIQNQLSIIGNDSKSD